MASLIQGNVTRIVMSTLVFATPGELLFGCILIYYFRVLERLMGVSKFAAFACLSFVVSMLLQVGMLVAFPATVKSVASGPYGFIFSCLTLVFFRVARLHDLFVIFGIPVTDKFFAYLLATQMTFSGSPATVFSAIAGVITGCIYEFDVVGLQRLVFPKPLRKLAAMVFMPGHQAASITHADLQAAIGVPGGQTQGRAEQLVPGAMGMGMPYQPSFGGAQQRGAAAAVPAVRPSEDVVQSLMAVTGVSRHQVEQALIAANNNPDAATNALLDQA